MAQPYRMPPRGAPGAPSFDPARPHSLLDFFDDLECLLDEAGVDSEDGQQRRLLWRGFASFAEGRPYEDFKKEVVSEYLGDDGKGLYTLGDLRRLVSDAAKAGFRSSSEFRTYSRRFRIVADHLVKHAVLRDEDRDRLFVQGLPGRLQRAVLERLKVKCPDVLAPRQPYYSVVQVAEATEFVLDAQDGDALVGRATVRTADTDAVRPHLKLKTEVSLSELTDALKSTLRVAALFQQQWSTGASPAAVRQVPPDPRMDPSTPPSARHCHYCGDNAHVIRRCPQVDADTAAGLVARNAQGRVVLASGSDVPSATLRDRVREHYRQHPGVRPL
ncbi:hypothetical protein OH77DRAFT_1589949 [Trametes cingulata]|nr:hypothetical protein OH77DRAFT_1589949 [Trametes cingulata]